VPPQHGREVRLTIDMHLQDAMEEVLEEAYAYHRPHRITAVLMEPFSGAVMAMASRPHIDRDAKDGINANLAVAGKYEPGSVFKVVTYAAALDARLTSPDDALNCDPGQKFLEKVGISDHYSGTLKMSDAFAFSSNRAAFVLAHRLGEKRFMKSVESFGFGKPTGIMLTGESSGTLHHPGTKWWDGLTFSRMSYGHAIQVTPLQMCTAVAAIANGGTLMRPQIVKDVRDGDGNVVQTFAPEPVRRVCSEKTALAMRKVMMEVVSSPRGTGTQAAIPGITVAGKTGTSQLYNANGTAIRAGHYCVSFAGFAPAENPALCAIIVVDDPEASKEDLTGGKLAAPIFSRLMQRCLQNLAVSRVGQPVAASDSPKAHE
jgi:cell division protein FtsI/penicillin-binding protein 2